MANTDAQAEVKDNSFKADTLRERSKEYKTVKTETGSKSKNCGDEVSTILAGISNPEKMRKIGEAILGAGTLKDRYLKLNDGQIKMNISNLIRGWVKRVEAGKVEGYKPGTAIAHVKKVVQPYHDEIVAAMKKADAEKAKAVEMKKAEVKAKADAKAKTKAA